LPRVTSARVARRHIFLPKIQIWVNFGGTCNGRCWYILRPIGLFYGYLVYLWPFGIFMVIWYKKKSGNPDQNQLWRHFHFHCLLQTGSVGIGDVDFQPFCGPHFVIFWMNEGRSVPSQFG
jgi:hypothetical protein